MAACTGQLMNSDHKPDTTSVWHSLSGSLIILEHA